MSTILGRSGHFGVGETGDQAGLVETFTSRSGRFAAIRFWRRSIRHHPAAYKMQAATAMKAKYL